MYTPDSFRHPDSRYGPLQIVHDFQFVALNLTEDFNWTEETTEEEKVEHIRRRLERLSRRGYGGVVVNVAFRDYLEDPAAWEQMVKTVDMARDLGLRLWIYDEQYYPSGMAGGLVLRDHPQYEAQALACVTQDVDSPEAPVRIPSPRGHSSLCFAYAVPLNEGRPDFEKQVDLGHLTDAGGGLCWDCPGGSWRVYCFFTRSLYEGTYLCRALRAPHRNISVCDDRAMKRFLDLTFDACETWLGDRLGRDIEAVFTDEPSLFWYTPYPEGHDPHERVSKLPTLSTYEIPDLSIPMLPYVHWTYHVEEVFQSRNGYPLPASLPRLFEGGAEASQVRLDYYGTLDALFDDAFNRQYRDRLARYRMDLSGHMINEERFSMHPWCYGDILRNLGRMDIPGCDLLSSSPEPLRRSMACKLASSAAHGYGRKHVMIEASNMCDKDQSLPVSKLCCAMAIEFALGVDTITSYYGENLYSEPEYETFAAYVARLGALFDGGVHVSQALLYYPFRQLARESTVLNPATPDDTAKAIESSLTGMARALLDGQLDFDFVNDEVLRACRVEAGQLVTPAGETPFLLLFPDIDWLDADIAALAKDAAARGVEVAFHGDPRPIAGLEDMANIRFLGSNLSFVSRDLVTVSPYPELLCLHKRFSGQDLYLLVNAGSQTIGTSARIPCERVTEPRLTLLNPFDGAVRPLPCEREEDRLVLTLELAPFSARVLALENKE